MCGCRLPLHPLKWPAVNEDLHAGHISSEPPVRWRLWPSPPQCCCNTTKKGSYGAAGSQQRRAAVVLETGLKTPKLSAQTHLRLVIRQLGKFLSIINWMGMNANYGRSCFIFLLLQCRYKEYHYYTLLMDTGNLSNERPRWLPLQYLQQFYYGVKSRIPHKEIPISSAYWQVWCPLLKGAPSFIGTQPNQKGAKVEKAT